jgi:thiosulfate/3-mercaptopyruvate sulfurtransferase
VDPFEARPWRGTVTIEEVADRSADTVLLDARDAERYRGDTEPVDPRAGHIPGARSLPLTGLLAADGTFLPAAELRSAFAAVGLDAGGRAIAQCGSGVTACHLILAAEVAGIGRPDLYVGSWSEWSSTDRPIATGSHP